MSIYFCKATGKPCHLTGCSGNFCAIWPNNLWLPTYNPCANGHVWYYSSGGSNDEVPEGMLCQCGQMKWHRETCPCCGQTVSKSIPANQ